MRVYGKIGQRIAKLLLMNSRVQKQLRSWGYNITSDSAVVHNRFELSLQSVLKLYGITCIIDVGANTGQFAKMCRRIGFRGKIVSFEPVSSNYTELSAAARLSPPWSVHALALGDMCGTMPINVSKMNVFSSFLPLNKFGLEMFRSEADVETSESVRVERLDDVFDSLIDLAPDDRCLLKLDTQGYDLKVIAGARQSLPRIDAIITELSMMPIYDGMPSYREALTTYEALGFMPSDFEPVTNDSALRAIEFDCLLVRPQLETPPTAQ